MCVHSTIFYLFPRKLIICFENIIFRSRILSVLRKLIICFENMFFKANIIDRKEANYLIRKYDFPFEHITYKKENEFREHPRATTYHGWHRNWTPRPLCPGSPGRPWGQYIDKISAPGPKAPRAC